MTIEPAVTATNDDINEIYRATLRDLDHERDKRWRAEQEIKHLNGLVEELRRQSEHLSTNRTERRASIGLFYLGN